MKHFSPTRRAALSLIAATLSLLAARAAEPAPAHKPRVALAGDSTVTTTAGWGAAFEELLGSRGECIQLARGGQSSKSFRDSGQWAKVIASKPDYVLIQFGHNDMPGKGPHRETDPATTYSENLTRFVTEARAIGAQPILVTSLTRRIFEASGKMRGELAPYAEAARKVAAEQRVPLIDLYALSIALVEKLGPAGVEPFEPMDPPKPTPAMPKPEPRRDGTHLNARGSIVFGEIIAGELARVLPDRDRP